MLFGARDFAHQLMDVPFGVAKGRHPEIIGWHGRNQARRGYNRHAGVHKPLMGRCEIGNTEVEDGTRMIKFRRFGGAEQEPHAAANVKNKGWGGGKEGQTPAVTGGSGGRSPDG